MQQLSDQLIGQTIVCGEEWYQGRVYYVNIYKAKTNEYFARRKVYLNTFSGKIDREMKDERVIAPFGFEMADESDINKKEKIKPEEILFSFIQQVSHLHCPKSYGFEGAETFPDCGECVVCVSKEIMSVNK